MELELAPGRKLALLEGDITRVPADAIANAANSALAGGGGVDGAIHRAGGPSLMAELNLIRAQQGGCPTGSAVATGAGRLPAQYVFHAVGPVWRGGATNEPALLSSSYRTCLALAEARAVKKITFPSISTGVYGYPVALAAPVALRVCAEHLRDPSHTVEEVCFVLFDAVTFEAYREAFATLGA